MLSCEFILLVNIHFSFETILQGIDSKVLTYKYTHQLVEKFTCLKNFT